MNDRAAIARKEARRRLEAPDDPGQSEGEARQRLARRYTDDDHRLAVALGIGDGGAGADPDIATLPVTLLTEYLLGYLIGARR